MWTIIKIDRKKFSILKKEFFEKIGNDVKFYNPKLQLKRYIKSKIYVKENYLLGDYLFCFHKNFEKNNILTSLKYCKGLKYFLGNFSSSQKEIENFIDKCKENEDSNGYIRQTFFSFENIKKYQFISGPFTNMIFTIFNENKFFIEATMGKYNMTVSKEENLFRPV